MTRSALGRIFNSFFYTNLETKGYASVQRWTRKVRAGASMGRTPFCVSIRFFLSSLSVLVLPSDATSPPLSPHLHPFPSSQAKVNNEGPKHRALDFDKIIFPCNISGNHWVCGCIDMKRKRIEYYDSFHGSAGPFFRNVRSWLEGESQAHYNRAFDFEGETGRVNLSRGGLDAAAHAKRSLRAGPPLLPPLTPVPCPSFLRGGRRLVGLCGQPVPLAGQLLRLRRLYDAVCREPEPQQHL